MRWLVAVTVLTASSIAGQSQHPTPCPQISTEPPVGQGRNGDWANVERYRDADRSLIANPVRGRVVFMGDSITQGWADQPFLKDNQAFVGRGISGQTAGQMLVRFRGDVINLHPAAVQIMAGTNDVAENNGPEPLTEIEGYIASMAELAQANGIKVIIASIPPATDFGWHKGLRPAPKIRVLNGWLRTFAARHALAYADYWSVLAARDGGMKSVYSEDGVHPNAAGYEAMRPIAEAALKHALSSK